MQGDCLDGEPGSRVPSEGGTGASGPGLESPGDLRRWLPFGTSRSGKVINSEDVPGGGGQRRGSHPESALAGGPHAPEVGGGGPPVLHGRP